MSIGGFFRGIFNRASKRDDKPGANLSHLDRPTITMPRNRGGRVFPNQIHYLGMLQGAANKVYKKYALEREAWLKRPKVKVGELVRVLPGGRHAMYMSNIGLVRKPL